MSSVHHQLVFTQIKTVNSVVIYNVTKISYAFILSYFVLFFFFFPETYCNVQLTVIM